MKVFYLTFGQKYARESHPYWLNSPKQFVHPEGWWEILAPDKEKARIAVDKHLGIYWASLYSEEEFKSDYFPMGKIGELKYTEPIT